MEILKAAIYIVLATIFIIVIPVYLITGYATWAKDFVSYTEDLNLYFDHNATFEWSPSYIKSDMGLYAIYLSAEVYGDGNATVYLETDGEPKVFEFPKEGSYLTGRSITIQGRSRGTISIEPKKPIVKEPTKASLSKVVLTDECLDTCDLSKYNISYPLKFKVVLNNATVRLTSIKYVWYRKLDKVEFTLPVVGSDGTFYPSEVLIRDPEGNVVFQTENKKTLFGSTPFVVKPGDYNIELAFEGTPLTKLEFKNVSISVASNPKVKFEDYSTSDYVAFAVDPNLDFEDGKVQFVSNGGEIYKCKDWDWSNKTCNSAWVFLLNTTKGEVVTLDINESDPAFVELVNVSGVSTLAGNKGFVPPILIDGKVIARDRSGREIEKYSAIYKSGKLVKYNNETYKKISKGLYNVTLLINKTHVKKVDVENALLDRDTHEIVVDELEPDPNSSYKLVYHINASSLQFKALNVNVVAKGNIVYECKDWDFSGGKCNGDLDPVRVVSPGKAYTLSLNDEEVVLVEKAEPINCVAEDLRQKDEFIDACDSPDGTSLAKDDGVIERHFYGKSTSKKYGGVLINLSSSNLTNCTNIEKVELCYEWWRGPVKPKDCEISVDTGDGNWNKVVTSCPNKAANPGISCVDITNLKSWACSDFTSGKIRIKSQLGGAVGNNGNSYAVWDALYINVSYSTSSTFVKLIDPPNGTEDSNGQVNFVYDLSDYSKFDQCSLILDNKVVATDYGFSRNRNRFHVVDLDEGIHSWKISCLSSNEYYNTTERIIYVTRGGAGGSVEIPIVMKNSREDAIPSKFIFKDSSNGEVELETNYGGLISANLSKGKYDIDIIPKNGRIKKIEIKGAMIDKDTAALMFFEDNITTNGPVNRFAINPLIDFTSANITVTARGTRLLKCKDWNWTSQTCDGRWTFIKDITPGTNYTITLTPEDPGYAESGAIMCYTSPCVAGSDLLMSRDNLDTPEPNFPNTIDTCTDGTSGSYKSDESIENITVTDLNSTYFRVGDTVKVEIWAYCYGSGSYDNINFVYANNTSEPVWKVVDYVDPCPGGGFQKVSTTFQLENVTGNHSVRGIIQYSGDVTSTCGTGDYDDNDDVSFKVYSSSTERIVVPDKNLYVDCRGNDNIEILGLNWNSNINVTLNVTYLETGENVLYENVTTNSSGEFLRVLPIAWILGNGKYKIFAFEWNNTSLNASSSFDVDIPRCVVVRPVDNQEIYEGFKVVYWSDYDNDTLHTLRLDDGSPEGYVGGSTSNVLIRANEYNIKHSDYWDENVTVCGYMGYEYNENGDTNPLVNVTVDTTVTPYQIELTNSISSPQWHCINVSKSYFSDGYHKIGFKCENCQSGASTNQEVSWSIMADSKQRESYYWNGTDWIHYKYTYYIRVNYTELGDDTSIQAHLPNGTVDTIDTILKTEKVDRAVTTYNNTLLGNYTFCVYWKGCTSNRTVESVDTSPPNITVESPLNQTYLQDVWFNVTAVDNYKVGSCKFSLDGQSNTTMSNDSYTHFYYHNSSMTIGQHNVVFYCNDSEGNLNQTDTIYFTVVGNAALYAVKYNISDFQFASDTYVDSVSIYFNTSASSTNFALLSTMNVRKVDGTLPNDVYCLVRVDGKNIREEKVRTVNTTDDEGSTGLAPVKFSVGPGEHNLTVSFKRSGDGTVNVSDFDLVLLKARSNLDNEVRLQITNESYTHSSSSFEPAFNWTVVRDNQASTYIFLKQTTTSTAASDVSYYIENLNTSLKSPYWSGRIESASDVSSLFGTHIDSEYGNSAFTIQSKTQTGQATVNVSILDLDLKDSGGNVIDHFNVTNSSSTLTQNLVLSQGLHKVASATITPKSGDSYVVSAVLSLNSTSSGTYTVIINSTDIGEDNCSSKKEIYIPDGSARMVGIVTECTGMSIGNSYTIDLWVKVPQGSTLSVLDENLVGLEAKVFDTQTGNLPPAPNDITNPTDGALLKGSVNITWDEFVDPNGDSVTYNISLFNPDGTFNSTINGSTTFTYQLWDTTGSYDGNYTLVVEACDPSSACSNSSVNIRVDNTPPQWSNVGENATSVDQGESVKLYAYWADNTNLSFAILSTNESGVWENKTEYGSPLAFSSKEGWSNFTWSNNSVTGTVAWKIWANDTAGNWNVTDTQYFDIVANNLPTILNVTSPGSVDPVEGGVKLVEIRFNAYDYDGNSDLNDTTAKAIIDLLGTTYQNNSCVSSVVNATVKEYTCTFTLHYYDNYGDWSINVSVRDNSNALAYNDSETFYYSKLAAATLINSTVNFGSVSLGSSNATNINNPMIVNNTGNMELNINITGADLVGVTDPSYVIGVGNVTFNDDDNSTGDGSGNPLKHLSTDPINYNPNATLLKKKSFMYLYWWINIPQGLMAQAYNATWTILVYG